MVSPVLDQVGYQTAGQHESTQGHHRCLSAVRCVLTGANTTWHTVYASALTASAESAALASE